MVMAFLVLASLLIPKTLNVVAREFMVSSWMVMAKIAIVLKVMALVFLWHCWFYINSVDFNEIFGFGIVVNFEDIDCNGIVHP